jgi:hypothetical protein
VPSRERKNCFGTNDPVPKFDGEPTVFVTVNGLFSGGRGLRHPVSPGAIEPLIVAVKLCTMGGAKASKDMPSGNGRRNWAAKLTLVGDGVWPRLGPQVGKNEVWVDSAM